MLGTPAVKDQQEYRPGDYTVKALPQLVLSRTLIRDGVVTFAIAGGLWLLSYADWLPDGFVSEFLESKASRTYLPMFVALGLIAVAWGFALVVLPKLLARTSARTQAQFGAAAVILGSIVFGTVLFLGLAGTALFLAFVVGGLFGLDAGFILVVGGVVLVAMVLVVVITYFSRRARNPTEPAGTSFEHVLSTSGGVCFHSCSAATFIFLFCWMCVLIAGTIEEGNTTAFPLAPFAIIAAVSLCIFAVHARMLNLIKHARGGA
jgi:hypothetical protein